jgi:hypothetical protein
MAEVIGEVQGEHFSFFVLTLWSTPFNLQCSVELEYHSIP